LAAFWQAGGRQGSQLRELGRNSKYTDMEPHTPNSVQGSSLLTVRLHRLHFYVVLRKLIAKLQAFPKSIQETSMVRFYSSIHSYDEMLLRQMSCDSVFHGIPHPKSLPHIERRPNASAAFPTGKS
jgi:hypothetical protein